MEVFLIDGTYELFRHYYAMPPARDADGQEIRRRARGRRIGRRTAEERRHAHRRGHRLTSSNRFATICGPATRPAQASRAICWSQFRLLEDAMTAMGVMVWPMVEFEADDALASAAEIAARDARVTRVVICTPDKDLAQCVRGTRVVQMDRRKRVTRDEAGVMAKFGVPPALIPDYLALVGDSSDGYPGLRGWGPKTAAGVADRATGRSKHSRPSDWAKSAIWRFSFVTCAAARDLPLFDSVDALEWHGTRPEFAALSRGSTARRP